MAGEEVAVLMTSILLLVMPLFLFVVEEKGAWLLISFLSVLVFKEVVVAAVAANGVVTSQLVVGFV